MARKKSRQRKPETGRDRGGRFLPGNPGGPGGPRRGVRVDYRDAVNRACTPADLEEVVRALVREAMAGSEQAAAILLERVLGKPRRAEDGATLTLPPLADSDSLSKAASEVVSAAGDGRITTEQADGLLTLIERMAKIRALESGDGSERTVIL